MWHTVLELGHPFEISSYNLCVDFNGIDVPLLLLYKYVVIWRQVTSGDSLRLCRSTNMKPDGTTPVRRSFFSAHNCQPFTDSCRSTTPGSIYQSCRCLRYFGSYRYHKRLNLHLEKKQRKTNKLERIRLSQLSYIILTYDLETWEYGQRKNYSFNLKQ